MKSILIELIYWTWCFPQTVIGIIYFLISKNNHVKVEKYKHSIVTTLNREHTGGFCWGKYIFIDKTSNKDLIKHEYGHTLQSFILGPLYIPVIWIPSGYNLYLIKKIDINDRERYLEAYNEYWKKFPEDWADKLGKVNRK